MHIFRPMSLARLSRLRSAALRLDGDQTAEKATGSGSSAKGKKTMPFVGNSAVTLVLGQRYLSQLSMTFTGGWKQSISGR